MKPTLRNAVVWITGASSGLGTALALEAARRGARLVLSGRRAEALAEVARACAPAQTAILAFDLLDPIGLSEACDRAASFFGPLDVLILNAGQSQRATFLETSPEVFSRVMDLDFGAPAEMLRRCLPPMLERGSGSVVAISSLAGLAGAPLRPAYSAAKHALAGLCQNIRSELWGRGIRIVTVYPGYVRTGVGRNALNGAGESVGLEDPRIAAGADPEPVARRIIDSSLAGPLELRVAFDAKARLGLFLSRRAPGLWARLSARHAGIPSRNDRRYLPREAGRI